MLQVRIFANNTQAILNSPPTHGHLVVPKQQHRPTLKQQIALILRIETTDRGRRDTCALVCCHRPIASRVRHCRPICLCQLLHVGHGLAYSRSATQSTIGAHIPLLKQTCENYDSDAGSAPSEDMQPRFVPPCENFQKIHYFFKRPMWSLAGFSTHTICLKCQAQSIQCSTLNSKTICSLLIIIRFFYPRQAYI